MAQLSMSKKNFAIKLAQMFMANGASIPASGWLAAHVLHESADGQSRLAKEDNNYSGLKYAGQRGAVPTKRNSPEGNPYAHFNSFNDWFRAHMHEVTKGSQPIKATSLGEFIDRLEQNKYFTANPYAYELAVNHKWQQYGLHVPTTYADVQTKQDSTTPQGQDEPVKPDNRQKGDVTQDGSKYGTKDGTEDFWGQLKWWHYALGALGAILVVDAITD